jgi:hypothetical protein
MASEAGYKTGQRVKVRGEAILASIESVITPPDGVPYYYLRDDSGAVLGRFFLHDELDDAALGELLKAAERRITVLEAKNAAGAPLVNALRLIRNSPFNDGAWDSVIDDALYDMAKMLLAADALRGEDGA